MQIDPDTQPDGPAILQQILRDVVATTTGTASYTTSGDTTHASPAAPP